MEIYKHQYAKRVLADWLRSPGQTLIGATPNRDETTEKGVYLEYPICLSADNKLIGAEPVWDESDYFWAPEHRYAWGKAPVNVPSYQDCIDHGLLPVLVFDIAVLHKGWIRYAFEVVHKHGIDDKKRKYLDRMWIETNTPQEVYVVDADWILQQVRPPKTLRFMDRYSI